MDQESEPLSTLCQRAPPEACRLQLVIAPLLAKGEEACLSKKCDKDQNNFFDNKQWTGLSENPEQSSGICTLPLLRSPNHDLRFVRSRV